MEKAFYWLSSRGGGEEQVGPFEYDTLLLEGGAVKGVTYAGAAHALERSGMLPLIRRYAGSSAGAMAAAALCAGCSATQVTSALLDIEFSALLDADTLEFPSALRQIVESKSVAEAVSIATRLLFEAISREQELVESPTMTRTFSEDDEDAKKKEKKKNWSVADPLDVLRRLTTEYGLFRGTVLEERMEALLFGATGRANLTFAELRLLTGRELRVTATSITRQRVTYFDADVTPDLCVARAVRASSAVPFLFAPVEIDGELFIDGGALKNMPLDAFAVDLPPPPGRRRSRKQHRARCLALSIRSPTVAEETGAVEVSSIGTYAAALLETVTWGEGSANCLARAAELPGIDIVELGAHRAVAKHALDFNLTLNDKLAMLAAGYDALSAHLAQHRQVDPTLLFHGDSQPRRPWKEEVTTLIINNAGDNNNEAATVPAANDDDDDDEARRR